MCRTLVRLERIEGFIGVANERKTHFSLLFFRHCADLCSVRCAGILLRNLVNGEVRHIDVGAESRLEWCTNVAQLVPDHTAEKGVVLDLCSTAVLATFVADTMLSIA